MSLRSKPLVEFPFASGNLKLGFEVGSRWESNRQYLLALLKGRSGLFQLASDYFTSWSTANPTVLHYRDYFLSKALLESLVNCQYKDESKTILTRHASKAWKAYSYDEIWPYRKPIAQHPPNYKYADLLGSLAYYSTQIDQDLSPTQLLRSLVNLVWGDLGFKGNPTERLTQLYSALNLSASLSVVPEALTSILGATQGKALKQLYEVRRQQPLLEIDNLPLRVFLGEYEDFLFEVTSPILSDFARDSVLKTLKASLSLIKPSGGLLVLQALALEGYLLNVELLNAQPESVLRTSLDTFYADSAYSELKYQLASNLALSYDAYSMQSTLGSLYASSEKARGVKQLALYWLSGSDRTSVLSTEVTRINVIQWYEAPELRTTEASETADPQFLALQQQPPIGKTRLLKADKQFGNRINLQVTDILGNPVEGQVFPLYGPGSTGNLESTGAPGSYSLILTSGNPVALVGSNVDTAPIELQAYLNLQTASQSLTSNISPDLFYTNVVPVFPQPADTTTTGIESAFEDTLTTYDLLFALQSTSNPRGSDGDVYLANGLSEPGQQDYQTDLSAMRADIYGYRQETTARTLGLVSLLDSVHLESAIQVFKDWIPSKSTTTSPTALTTTITKDGKDISLMSGGSLTSESTNLA
jgi:hypothetical protein